MSDDSTITPRYTEIHTEDLVVRAPLALQLGSPAIRTPLSLPERLARYGTASLPERLAARVRHPILEGLLYRARLPYHPRSKQARLRLVELEARR